MSEYIQVVTNTDSEAEARRIAWTLVEQRLGQAVVLEDVAGEQYHICAQMLCGGEHAAQASRAVAAMRTGGIAVIDVDIGTVDDGDAAIRVGNQNNNPRSTERSP